MRLTGPPAFSTTSQKRKAQNKRARRWLPPASCSLFMGKRMKPYAEQFYKSSAWRKTAQTYLQSRGYLCERCLARGIHKPAALVHHKTHISPDNINVPEISLSWDNLEAVCRECHAELHHQGFQRPYKIDSAGRVLEREAPLVR